MSGAAHPERVVGEGVKDGHRHPYSDVIGCVAASGGVAGRVSGSLIVDAEKDGEWNL